MTQNKTEWTPSKPREYRLYRIWKTLPFDKAILGNTQNEDLQELLDIQTQNDFAERFSINKDTLTEWNKKPVPAEYADITFKDWLKELSKDVSKLLYEGMQQRKDPATAKLLFELAGEYTQKQEVQVSGTEELFDTIRSIAERNNESN